MGWIDYLWMNQIVVCCIPVRLIFNSKLAVDISRYLCTIAFTLCHTLRNDEILIKIKFNLCIFDLMRVILAYYYRCIQIQSYNICTHNLSLSLDSYWNYALSLFVRLHLLFSRIKENVTHLNITSGILISNDISKKCSGVHLSVGINNSEIEFDYGSSKVPTSSTAVVLVTSVVTVLTAKSTILSTCCKSLLPTWFSLYHAIHDTHNRVWTLLQH